MELTAIEAAKLAVDTVKCRVEGIVWNEHFTIEECYALANGLQDLETIATRDGSKYAAVIGRACDMFYALVNDSDICVVSTESSAEVEE